MIWTALAAVGNAARKVPWQVWTVLGILLTAWMWGNHRYSQGIEDERDRWEQAAAEAQKRADKATLDAGEQRATDTIRNTEAERARDEAIDTATPGQAPDDANRALACARLRASGQHATAASAGCGSGN